MKFSEAVKFFKDNYSWWKKEAQPTKEFMEEFHPMSRNIDHARAAMLTRDTISTLYGLMGEQELVETLSSVLGNKDLKLSSPFTLDLSKEAEGELVKTVKRYFQNRKTIVDLVVITFFKGSDLKSKMPKVYNFYKAVNIICKVLDCLEY